MFAAHAATPKTAVAMPRVDRLITVVTTETLMQRVSRCHRLLRVPVSPAEAAVACMGSLCARARESCMK
jgi:hypothetical protein